MDEIDKLFGETKANEHKAYDKNEWVAKKKAERAETFELIDTAAGEMTDPDKLEAYLDMQSQFDRYSVANALLVAKQMPQATRLADATTWQASGSYIKKGEKSIVIIEPGEEYQKDDGTRGMRYNTKRVFDVTQTTAEIKAERKPKLDDKALVTALVKASPVDIRISSELPEGSAAIYMPEKKAILIRQGMDGKDIFRALSFEIAHAKLDRGNYSRSNCDLSAFCTAYLTCRRYGVEPGKYNLRSLPFKGVEAKEIRTQLSAVRENANAIANTITKALETKNKEQAR